MATTVASTFPPSRTRSYAGLFDLAIHGYATVLAATLIVVGLIWDISWHMSIGRDTFWTPAHLLIQGGGLLAGGGSGLLALHITFRGTEEERRRTVNFWGFRAPFGAWVCLIGCGAMLTSAPFDDWWHNAYGLDVRIVSPPHILLGIGMMAIVMGATLSMIALQNREDSTVRARASFLYAVATGMFVTILSVLLMDYTGRSNMHSGIFYRAVSMTLPIVLVGITVSGRSKWPATTSAAIYMAVVAGTCWILMLFPASPKLGPIYREVTHYIPLDFPLLLVFPALAIDLTWKRVREKSSIVAAIAIGATFLITTLVVQWPFADFLMAHSRNWFFHGDNFVYWQSVASEHYAFEFDTPGPNDWPLSVELLVAYLCAVVASFVGLKRGAWMTRVQR